MPSIDGVGHCWLAVKQIVRRQLRLHVDVMGGLTTNTNAFTCGGYLVAEVQPFSQETPLAKIRDTDQ